MTEIWTVIVAFLVVVVLLVAGSSLITAYERTPAVMQKFLDEVDARCDLCLYQFDEVQCDHNSIDKVCTALRDSYCIANCTVQLQNK